MSAIVISYFAMYFIGLFVTGSLAYAGLSKGEVTVASDVKLSGKSAQVVGWIAAVLNLLVAILPWLLFGKFWI